MDLVACYKFEIGVLMLFSFFLNALLCCAFITAYVLGKMPEMLRVFSNVLA